MYSRNIEHSYVLILGLTIGSVLARYDVIDEIEIKLDKVTAENCHNQHASDMFLPQDTVSLHPDFNVNRLHLQNMALSRGFFWSYILQSRFIRPATSDTYDPGMMYYYLSTVADVSANLNIDASAIYFSPNSFYTSSYRGFFNKTLSRFAPRTFRLEDLNVPVHIRKIFDVRDLGAFQLDDFSKDYTSEFYKINELYKTWLSDDVNKQSDTKSTYKVQIRYANNTNETYTFHGPPAAEETLGPVKWTQPYFDCGRSNKWLVSAVVPIADIVPRHTQLRHIEYPKYTAIAVLEMDFKMIDINQCPKEGGNDKPNHFADTARCKKATTECEPLHGFGFKRGGYQCRCKPGNQVPPNVQYPFQGEDIERTSVGEYYNGYDCLAEESMMQKDKGKSEESKKHISMAQAINAQNFSSHQVLKFIGSVNDSTCKNFHPQDLILPGEISFEAKQQFDNEAKMAVRLANFISAFLQVSDPNEVFSKNRIADKALTEDQMFGETLAIILSNKKISSAGTYWERNKFKNHTYFAPFAYKNQFNKDDLVVEDVARLNKPNEIYTDKNFFKNFKQRWSTNLDDLEKFYMKMNIRNNETGEYLIKYEHYPNFYVAAKLNHGYWTQPYFDCDGHVKLWLTTYAVPFFGWDSLKNKLEFNGVVAVSMDLLQLDINKYPDWYYEPNSFKSTSDKVEKQTSVEHIQTIEPQTASTKEIVEQRLSQKYDWLGKQVVFDLNRIQDETIQDETVWDIQKLLRERIEKDKMKHHQN